MSSIIRPEFMTPTPSSPKNKKHPKSLLGKRKYNDAFENNSYEEQRYGQDIYKYFFTINVGHNVECNM